MVRMGEARRERRGCIGLWLVKAMVVVVASCQAGLGLDEYSFRDGGLAGQGVDSPRGGAAGDADAASVEGTADVSACVNGETSCFEGRFRRCEANVWQLGTVCPQGCDATLGCVEPCMESAVPCAGECMGDACVDCASGDAVCPSGCTPSNDGDCLRELGASCSAGADCASGACADGVCCNTPCAEACSACNLPESTGTCSLRSFANDVASCGACNAACSSQAITARCTDGECDGECTSPFSDCNGDKRTDGCETDVRTDPEHCGACSNPCPYGVCIDEACASDLWGFAAAGPNDENRNGSTLMGMRILIGEAGSVAALGINTLTVGVQARLGLYTDAAGVPQSLVAQTGALSTLNGRTEGGVSATPVPSGFYWLFFLTAATVRVRTEAGTAPWWFVAQPFGELPATPPGLTSATLAIADAYVVTVPTP